jgi:hypothetical protein
MVSEHRLFQAIPLFKLDELNFFGMLNMKLQKFGFARVFLYQNKLVLCMSGPAGKSMVRRNLFRPFIRLRTDRV